MHGRLLYIIHYKIFSMDSLGRDRFSVCQALRYIEQSNNDEKNNDEFYKYL